LTADEREAMVVEALNAALTSWPRVEFVRMERRWRGLKTEAVEAGILVVLCVGGRNLVVKSSKLCGT
jgi:hypothetical protein